MDEAGTRKRLPPGQVLTEKWPVLTYGGAPRVDLRKWTFRCLGLVERETTWSWPEFQKLPRIEVRSDIHCVTRWSRLGNLWEGVALREIFERVLVRPEATAAVARTEEGYTTNIALEDLRSEDVLLATSHDGKDLQPDHGGPCRRVVPKLYFWKSAKWIRSLEFSDVNPPGFWEVNGYHMRADPLEGGAVLRPGDRCDAADAFRGGPATAPEWCRQQVENVVTIPVLTYANITPTLPPGPMGWLPGPGSGRGGPSA